MSIRNFQNPDFVNFEQSGAKLFHIEILING